MTNSRQNPLPAIDDNETLPVLCTNPSGGHPFATLQDGRSRIQEHGYGAAPATRPLPRDQWERVRIATQAKHHHCAWPPVHSSFRGNLVAHTSSRELAGWDSRDDQQGVDQPLLTHQAITQHYKLSRKASLQATLPSQETVLRQIETPFCVPPAYTSFFPTLCTSTCPHFGEPATLRHTVWACQLNAAAGTIPNPRYEQGERELTSSRLGRPAAAGASGDDGLLG